MRELKTKQEKTHLFILNISEIHFCLLSPNSKQEKTPMAR